jgi:DNA-binding NarL/FixJ family response regulator
MTMNILLVDDHPLLRGGMRILLRTLDAGLDMHEASNCAQALELVDGRDYDLVLLDLNMPGLNGLDALAALRGAAPGTPLVVFSGESEPRVVRAAIEGGAMGFIPKSSTPEVLIQALRLILAQGVYLPPLVLEGANAASSVPALPRTASTVLPGLTPRQMEILRCVIRGKSNKVIARELDLSEGTVKAHLSAVYQALGAHSRTEAVYAAANLGLRLA